MPLCFLFDCPLRLVVKRSKVFFSFCQFLIRFLFHLSTCLEASQRLSSIAGPACPAFSFAECPYRHILLVLLLVSYSVAGWHITTYGLLRRTASGPRLNPSPLSPVAYILFIKNYINDLDLMCVLSISRLDDFRLPTQATSLSWADIESPRWIQTMKDLLNGNFASQSNHIPQETKQFLQSSLILLHRSLASHNDQLSFRRKSRRLSWWRLLLPVISLLWLAPIATLFAFNYTNKIIGATLWCPRGQCSDDERSIYDNNYDDDNADDAAESAKRLNRADHNTLGALQLVAKALETWFVFIATSIIFDLSMIPAKKAKGLPIGYFLTHLRSTDLSYLLDPFLWTCSIFNSISINVNILNGLREQNFALSRFW